MNPAIGVVRILDVLGPNESSAALLDAMECDDGVREMRPSKFDMIATNELVKREMRSSDDRRKKATKITRTKKASCCPFAGADACLLC